MKVICKTQGCKRKVYIRSRGLCSACYGRFMYARHLEQRRADARRVYHQNPNKFHKKSRAWRAAHRKESRLRVAQWRRDNPAYTSVTNHYAAIQAGKHPSYKNVPYFKGWNPRRGGSFMAGCQWIDKHLGLRPDKKYQLHIIDRRLGFVPGNLAWVPRDKHRQEELVNKLLLENHRLRAENKRLRNSQ